MRIGIDGHVLGKNIGGVERFVRELVQQLPTEAPEHEYIVFVTKTEFATLQVTPNHIKGVQYVPLAFANPLFERLILLPWLVYRYHLDALLIQRLAPWFCGRCKLIATIHDLTPIKFAQAYKGLSNNLVRALTKNTIKRASLILTPTLAIKAEVEAYCTNVKAPIVAFYNGVDVSVFNQDHLVTQLPIEKPYLLTVGAIEKRKNIETIFEMLSQLNDYPKLELAIVGAIRDKGYFNELQVQLKALGLTKRVHYMGFMSESALINLYQNAALFITASRDEGFNIPPLEAMACGVPVVCSNIAVHLELFSNAAVFFNPNSADDLTDKIKSILDNTHTSQHLATQGHKKIAEFSWQRTAKNVAGALSLIE
ncbi:glycosyltransferase family 1 protein [Methylotenera sp.]|uniref:glycosyltransferase family 4 protein n=1 Tax=Methylotenera sp. TaxID=2051956 RepID=UPI0024880CE3|nr:glycosyltransferase family 1 protein [Methylotenera sp.]MDI1297802.1 glycosyltransferase family 1 protein [Methylotenera sp.]